MYCTSTGMVVQFTYVLFVFIIKGNSVASETDACTDLMSLGTYTTIDHSFAAAFHSNIKTGFVTRESMSKSDSNVYYAYILPICASNKEKTSYNCLALKTFSSFEELRSKNKKICWSKDIYVSAHCLLPTIRIVNGYLYCQIEPDSANRKPSIAKINLQTGKIITKRILTEGKETAKCLKTTKPAWKPECSGEYLDFSIRILVDENGIWIVYPAATTSNSIVEKISPNDLNPLSKKSIAQLKAHERTFLICGKLYVVPVQAGSKSVAITKAIDLVNSKNIFSMSVELVSSLPNGGNFWIHYNPKQQEIFMGWPNHNTIVYAVNKCASSYSKNIDFSLISSTFLWSLEPPGNEQMHKMIDTIFSFYPKANANTLQQVSNELIKCPSKICQKNGNTALLYCRIKMSISSLKVYSDARKIQISKRKTLQVYFHMDSLLNQQHFISLSSQIHRLHSYVAKNFDELKNKINKFRSSLRSYFVNLASFDQTKAKADADFVYGRLSSYNKKIKKITKILQPKLSELFYGALGSNLADITAKTLKLAVAISGMSNPIKSIAEGASATMDVMDAINDLAIATVDYTKLVFVNTQVVPKLKNFASSLTQQLTKNKQKHQYIKQIVQASLNKNLNKSELTKYADGFLTEYNNYDPGFNKSVIGKYGKMLETVVDELCDVLFKGSTILASVPMHVFAGRGDCVNTKIDIQALMALYEEMYDFQYDLMDHLAKVVRSKIAKESAKQLQTIDSELSAIERDRNVLKLRVYALQMFVTSDTHKIMLVHDSCTLIQYINGGELPSYCQRAIENPESLFFNKLVAFPFNKDMCTGDKIERFVRIPAMAVPAGNSIPLGTIDLTSLYEGKTTSFRIPNKKWLIENGWVNSEDTNYMLVIKRFELFLPNLHTQSKVHVSIVLDGKNSIVPNGAVYQFNVPVEYNFRYSQQQGRCYTGDTPDNPYKPPGCTGNILPICVESKGTGTSFVHPSIFASWKIKFVGTLKQPKPKGHFALKAGVSICKIRSLQISKRKTRDTVKCAEWDVPLTPTDKVTTIGTTVTPYITTKVPIVTTTKAPINPASKCCGDKGKVNDPTDTTNPCKNCPIGSTPKLLGYYCEEG